MTAPLFVNSKLKIKGANKHIHELASFVEAFSKTDFYRLHVVDGNKVRLEITYQGIPWPIPLLIGDAIHNLRTSLDMLAWDVVAMSGSTPGRYCKFPFGPSRQELVATVNGGEIKKANVVIADLIIDVIEPYIGGNEPLCSLHTLDITDKHRLIIPVFKVTQISGVFAESSGGGNIENCTFAVHGDGEFNLIQTDPGLNITNKGNPTLHICFAEGQPFEGEAVIPTLVHLSNIVCDVVDAFEKACSAP